MIAVGFPESLMGTRTSLHGWGVTHRLSRDSGLTACLQSLLSTAVSRHRSLSVAEGAVVQTAVLDALSVLSAKSFEGDNQGLSMQQREKLAKIKALALRSLHLQSVDPASIARESGISVRSLHRLFNSSGTSFGEWLRERRLERCWNEIREPGRARNTIAAIAFAWGFSDLRTFNRAFAARYGMTPSAARHLAAGRGFQADTAARKSSVSSSVASIASSGK
jgi:AraC-like DNA-binding protein